MFGFARLVERRWALQSHAQPSWQWLLQTKCRETLNQEKSPKTLSRTIQAHGDTLPTESFCRQGCQSGSRCRASLRRRAISIANNVDHAARQGDFQLAGRAAEPCSNAHGCIAVFDEHLWGPQLFMQVADVRSNKVSRRQPLLTTRSNSRRLYGFLACRLSATCS